MHKKTILKSELREKHTRARVLVKITVGDKPKQQVAKEVTAEPEEEPVVRKRSRKSQSRKAEAPAPVVEMTEETPENNE